VTEIRSIGTWASNAELIADAVVPLGWIGDHHTVLDCTYGKGRFWTKYTPDRLVGVDLNPVKAKTVQADNRVLPFPDRCFDVVVFDPPYRLNGTPDRGSDEAYGIDVAKTTAERMAGILEGAEEAARVCRKHLLIKCQDQVVSGEVRFQTIELHTLLTGLEPNADIKGDRPMRLAERFDFPTNGIPQPPGRRQLHARHDHSQLLVFTRTRRSQR